MSRLLLMLLCLSFARSLSAQTPQDEPNGETNGAATGELSLSEDVKAVLDPLFKSIKTAPVSRVTVEVLADSLLNGKEIDSKRSTYQIASLGSDRFTIYFKQQDRRTRIFSNEQETTVALAPDAYTRLPDQLDAQRAVTGLPLALGPYPEPVLALSLAGVDPAISLIHGMKSLELVDRKPFRGRVEAVHLHGVQLDKVEWDLWLATGEQIRPLRLLVDLTPMLRSSEDIEVPNGFSYQARFDFLAWRMTGEIDESLFTFTPPEEAKEYESIESYYESIAGITAEHPLLGKAAPGFKAERLSGEAVISAEAFKDHVVVLDFWASWCEPCQEMMPIIEEVTKTYADKDVLYYAVNLKEKKEAIESFLNQQPIASPVLFDPDGELAETFHVESLPLTIVIGKDGMVESIHRGFPGPEAFRQRLTDELEVLTIGGKIATAGQTENDGNQ